ncbi:hypothetical protein PBAL39_24670 [Pedobacter sp. BAL39]|uniref:M949_RS01915 family surface polysaccharide biosynthesis protein n=1 Tax=Pedobacter sp. BAL39 TaxID=391596 RepID=UPI0001559BEA|nr:hypothetical protein [Pedobacter sp. BAL39]EDM36520.1 hypothetical protein PBAL39_24670 [Pedobacter sp. BAL39]
MRRYLCALVALFLMSCGSGDQQENMAAAGLKADSLNAENLTSDSAATTVQVTPLQLLDSTLTAGQLPASIKYKGVFKQGLRFLDASGEQLLVCSEVEPYDPAKEGEDYLGSNVALYATLFKKSGTGYIRQWQVYDFISECPVELLAKFIPSTIQLTDLNENGHAEVWMVYQTTCQGDVSPQTMKLIMYESGKKHAAKGENRIMVGTEMETGGKMNMDDAFKLADQRISDYAKRLWKKNESYTFQD